MSILTDGTGATPNAERQPGTLSGPVQLGKNFEKKVRKHIDQVRNRVTPPEDIPYQARGESNVLQKSSTSELQRVVAGRRPTPEKPWLHSRMAE